MKVVLRICKTVLKFNVPFCLENPATSRVWYTDEVSKLIDAGAYLVTVDQCMYGSLWRKATAFLCGNIDPIDREAFCKRCQGRHGYCSKNGCKHVHLEGGHMTAKSQQYPAKFYTQLAKLTTSNLSMDACNVKYLEVVPPQPNSL